MKVDAGGDIVEERKRKGRKNTTSPARTHKRRDIWTHTCLKLWNGVKIRNEERERGDCSRERANQWRHDNELFPRQRRS